MISGKKVDKYFINLVSRLGATEAIEQFTADIKSGLVNLSSRRETTVTRNKYEDEWIEQDAKIPIQETYFIKVKDKEGNRHTILVDESDFTRVSEYDWWVRKNHDGEYFASTNIDGSFISLQQFILGIPSLGSIIIFKDRNKLNAKRNNMVVRASKVEKLRYKQRCGYTFD